MATPIKQIQTSDEVLHDIQSIEYIIGTQSASTNMWKGVSESNELYAGKVINYKLPYAGSTNTNTHTGLTTNTTLELTLANGSTVVYPVYRNASTAITTHYPVDSIVRLVFDPTSVTLNGHTFEGSWKTADYDSNTNTNVTQSNTTTNSFLPLIIKAATATSTVTTTVRFNSKLTGNPSSGAIKLNTTSITPTASSAITLSLPATGGTLALTSDIPDSLPPTAHTHAWGDINNPPASYTPTAHSHAWGDITNPPSSFTPTAHTHAIGSIYNGTSALSVNSSSSNIQMDGTASAGSGSALALANHVHPTDTSRAPINSPAFTGYPTLANAPSATMGVVNKGYVDDAIGGITSFDYTTTTTLPASGVKGTIYLVAHTHGTKDVYDEYIWAGNDWEKIGNTDIDLSNYVPTSRTINGKSLTTNISLTYSDVGAASTSHTHDYSKVSATAATTVGTDIGTITIDGNTTTLKGDFQKSPLIGNTSNTTPSQVAAALANGQDVFIETTQNFLQFNETFLFKMTVYGKNVSRLVVGSGIFKFGDNLYAIKLEGAIQSDTWNWNVTEVAKSSDIPSNVSELNNDAGYITTSSIPSITAAASLTTGITVGTVTVGENTTTFYAPAQIQSDWNATSGASLILNKPDSYTPTAHTHSEYVEKRLTYEQEDPLDLVTYNVVNEITNSTSGINIQSRATDLESSPTLRKFSTISYNYNNFSLSHTEFSGSQSLYSSEIKGDVSGIDITSTTKNFGDNGGPEGNNINIGSDNINITAPTNSTHNIGRVSISGADVSITGVTTPTSDTMAANKKYVDDKTYSISNIYSGNTALSTTTLAGVSGSTTASKATAGTTVELYQASVSNNVLNLTAYTLTPYTFADVTVPKATTAITVVKV